MSIYQVSFVHNQKTLFISKIITTKLCLSHKFQINSFCDISKSSTFQTQQTKKEFHTEQTFKNGALLGVGRLCELLLQQKGASV